MAVTFVRTFTDQPSSVAWAGEMHAKGYSVAVSDASDDVQLLDSDNADWAQVPAQPGGYFVVMAFNKSGQASDNATA